MKNIEQILSDNGVTITDEQKTAISKDVKENYKTVNDWQKQVDDNEQLRTTLKETQDKLKSFDGVDAEKLNSQIKELQENLSNKDAEHAKELADRDFNDLLKESIAAVKGKNAKAITALLDLDTLRESKNQKNDIAAALKSLAEVEDSKMLFGEPEPNPVGTTNVIGTVKNSGAQQTDTLKGAIAEHYNNKK